MRNIGYPLPAVGEESPGLECCIIYYPDNPAYRQALMGSLDYLATWLAWEKEPDHRAILAAAAWKAANELTQECFDMGCLSDLVTAINKINLTFNQTCLQCSYIDITGSGTTTDDIIPGVGPVPDTWGEQDTSGLSWSEYQAYICAAANRYVDFLIEQNDQFSQLANAGLLAIGVVAGIIALLSGGGLAIILALGAAANIFAAIEGAPSLVYFETVSNEIEAGRAEIRDTIACGGSLTETMDGIINSFAWAIMYQFVDWDNAARVIRLGKAASAETLPPVNPSDECSCNNNIYPLIYSFVDEPGPFSGQNTDWDSDLEGWKFKVTNSTPTGGATGVTGNILETLFGLADGTVFQVLQYEVGIRVESPGSSACDTYPVSLSIGTEQDKHTHVFSGPGQSVVFEGTITEDTATSGNDIVISVGHTRGTGCNNPSGNNYTVFDYIIAYVRATEPA